MGKGVENPRKRLDEKSLGQAVRLYMIAATPRYRSASLVQMRSCLGLFCSYAGSDTRLDRITFDRLLLFLDHCRLDRANGQSALRDKTRILKSFFAWLEMAGKTKASPARGLQSPRRNAPHVEPLPKEVLTALVQRLSSEALRAADPRDPDWMPLRDLVMVILLYGLGLRVGEACALEVRDFRHGPGAGDHFVIRSEASKGGYSPGIAPLTPEAARVIRLWFRRRQQFLPVEVNPHVLIADPAKSRSSNRAAPVSPCTIQRRLTTLFARYSLLHRVSGSVHPHRLRHSFAVEHLMNDNDLKTVARLLRHRNPQTTLTTYSSFTDTQIATKARRHSPLRGVLL
jgi:integrase/recombinase XerC